MERCGLLRLSQPVFAAIELRGKQYPRGTYAALAREVNRRFASPTIVLFRSAAGKLTVAFTERRRNLRDDRRDVVGKVSLIREIATGADPNDPADKPHRAHIDILAELALPDRLQWMNRSGKTADFDGLLAAWLDALDTDALNKRFYADLFAWFNRAVSEAKFPAAASPNASQSAAEEQAMRLITRLMFVWFIKEKGLAHPDLFIESQVKALLKDYDAQNGDSYYRAVLQNLFFATLNVEIPKRRFRREGNADRNPDHRNFNVYRYESEIAKPDELLALFSQTPFINGGLFDCLDSFDAQGAGGVRVDCFTDNPRHRAALSVPNRLFFDDDDGIIALFNKYKFTVEENTPVDQEVALDPELLGKAFENLLAAHNPETRVNARKRTGSYYTPRAVVDYMVDEALIGALSRKAHGLMPKDAPGARPDADAWRSGIRALLDYDDAYDDAYDDDANPFTPAETEALVRAVADIKIIDPAVGSGAFPMGALRKLTLALRRLDPDNDLWQALQEQIALERSGKAYSSAPTQKRRDDELQEISDAFEKYKDSDFGRKLYLIQNSIYGVDIQPVAAQIAKLRFFISLAIEQTANSDPEDNYGVRPLPNLETRFAAANALIGLRAAPQTALRTNAVADLHQRIERNRERHFHAADRREKARCRNIDANLREELAAALTSDDMGDLKLNPGDAAKIAAWNPYDQNAPAADWFEPDYMFGVSGGFDIVIANPPYIQLQRDGGALNKLYAGRGFKTLAPTGDIYQLFYEKGCGLLAPGAGLLAYITSNKWLKAKYGESTRHYLATQTSPKKLLDFASFQVFDNASVDTCILITQKGDDKGDLAVTTFGTDFSAENNIREYAVSNAVTAAVAGDAWFIGNRMQRAIKEKMEAVGTPLGEWGVSINSGIKTGCNDAFIIDGSTRQALIDVDPNSANIIKPLLRGRDVRRYICQSSDVWLIDTHNGYGDCDAVNIGDYPAVKAYLDTFYSRLSVRQDKGITPYNLRSCAYHEDFAQEKIVWAELSRSGNAFNLDDGEVFLLNTCYLMVGGPSRYLLGILNSKAILYYLDTINQKLDKNGWRWLRQYVERIPVPAVPAAAQAPVIALVDRILAAKAADAGADTADLEGQVDALVYALYGLAAGEIAAVEGR